MSKTSRDKGKAGEREAAALLHDLTGHTIRRRVRQDDGDSDLVGLPGWSVEVKRHRTASPADIAGWYAQAEAQADREGRMPLLLYRLDQQEWRARWPLSRAIGGQHWKGNEWAADTTPEAWAAVYRETAPTMAELIEAF